MIVSEDCSSNQTLTRHASLVTN